jgi:hypothetical protein
MEVVDDILTGSFRIGQNEMRAASRMSYQGRIKSLEETTAVFRYE